MKMFRLEQETKNVCEINVHWSNRHKLSGKLSRSKHKNERKKRSRLNANGSNAQPNCF